MLWLKALHIIFMVTWFAGLFYLPRLFVYHAMATDEVSVQRFKVMERKLYYGIMYPSAVLTLLTGFWMLYGYAWQLYGRMGWMHAKLGLVLILAIYHLYCGHLRKVFARDANRHSHVFYRWLNEFPVLVLAAIVILVVVRPF